jgi:catechol 2,3-dioxygenase-like lactoylglutathione lyase family enzyme
MKLTGVCFSTHDLGRAVAFYQDLGLTLKDRQGDRYASFGLDDGLELGIKAAGAEREVPGAGTIFVATTDARSDFDAARAAHRIFYKELYDASWGLTFSILDPDGNKIEYMQRKA